MKIPQKYDELVLIFFRSGHIIGRTLRNTTFLWFLECIRRIIGLTCVPNYFIPSLSLFPLLVVASFESAELVILKTNSCEEVKQDLVTKHKTLAISEFTVYYRKFVQFTVWTL